ncbi:hypothetical protein CDAR_239481 [Caerostris darwini]|uniref:Uncharacterized protein n=1 Tax=Caerostris darwini TaxID=1538125 RepID=A0AAV4SQB6_9ARAC|nr:hypothetical protein CDAR_239481 [Caerostris darwini]
MGDPVGKGQVGCPRHAPRWERPSVGGREMTTFRAEEFLEGLDFLRFSYAFPCFRFTLFLFLLQGCELFQEKRGLVKWGDFSFWRSQKCIKDMQRCRSTQQDFSIKEVDAPFRGMAANPRRSPDKDSSRFTLGTES